jgi:hypothetical protein
MNERERQALYEAERVRRRQDAQAGRQLRDEAIQRVDEHAAPAWKDVAYAAVAHLSSVLPEFTTDEVWYAIANSDDVTTHELRAMGAVMRRAQRAGLIEPTDRYMASTRAVCHSAPKRIWRAVR